MNTYLPIGFLQNLQLSRQSFPSHLWIDGRLPQAGLIVAEDSGHHLQLLLCQVWWGQPHTLHPRVSICLDFSDSSLSQGRVHLRNLRENIILKSANSWRKKSFNSFRSGLKQSKWPVLTLTNHPQISICSLTIRLKTLSQIDLKFSIHLWGPYVRVGQLVSNLC